MIPEVCVGGRTGGGGKVGVGLESAWPWATGENARKSSMSHELSMPRGTKNVRK